MVNGSVEDRLQCRRIYRLSGGLDDPLSSHHPTAPLPLDWRLRLAIAIGTAKALQFLHTVKEKPLIHGDIKSANILLDCNFQPKLGDFGLAREGPMSPRTSRKVSRVHGTKPYIPDEYLRDKKLSTKVDCYSYGVVLFELCSGLKAYCEKRRHKYLKDLVCEGVMDSGLSIDSLQDNKAGPDTSKVFPALLQLGKECVVRLAKKRPDMASVYQRLEDFNRQDQDKRMSQASMVSYASSPTPHTNYLLGIHESNFPSNGYPTFSTNPSSPISMYPSNISNHSSIRPPISRIMSPDQKHLMHGQRLPLYNHPNKYHHLLPNQGFHHPPSSGGFQSPNLAQRYLYPNSIRIPGSRMAEPHVHLPGNHPDHLPDVSALSLKPSDPISPHQLANVHENQHLQLQPPRPIVPTAINSQIQPPVPNPNSGPSNPLIPDLSMLLADDSPQDNVPNPHMGHSISSNYHESDAMLPMLTVLGNKEPSEVDITPVVSSSEGKSQSTLQTDLSTTTTSSTASSSRDGEEQTSNLSSASLSAKGKKSFLDF